LQQDVDAAISVSHPRSSTGSRTSVRRSNSHQTIVKDNQNLKEANPNGAPADACKRAVLVPYV
jgi:hypothetical protein